MPAITDNLNYVPYLNLGHSIVILLCHTISISTMAKIVYHRYFNRDKYPRIQILSSQVLLFLGGNAYCALMMMPYYVYTSVRWSPVYDCKFLTCASLKFKSLPQYVCKLTFGSANLVLTLYFLWITRSSVCKQSIVTGETSTKYLGVYPSMFVSMDAAFCGIYYFIVLSKTKVHPASISS
ncbi:hypothetical protein DdX_14713 [Ditylenchus destructor]|uniref:Uncharacterized protein n=1 Tax=Ditylenchus destructor TaxID=166010 RepID=A0AAD4R1H6_9BILA|nr:hypothetical protein DdX_14713 [Ditylenchus destructor]